MKVLAPGSTTTKSIFLTMIRFEKDKLIITIDNINKKDYIDMLETLIWILGHFAEQQENISKIETLAWLANAMLPSEKQVIFEKE